MLAPEAYLRQRKLVDPLAVSILLRPTVFAAVAGKSFDWPSFEILVSSTAVYASCQKHSGVGALFVQASAIVFL